MKQRLLFFAIIGTFFGAEIILEHGDSDIVSEEVYIEILSHKHDPRP